MWKYLMFFVILVTSCTEDTDRYFVSREMRELPYLQNLPVMPDSVTWGSLQLGSGDDRYIPGPTDHYVQAVLYFNDSTWQALLQHADTSAIDAFSLNLDNTSFQEWFPPEVKSLFSSEGSQYLSHKPPFFLSQNDPWMARCLLGENNILFLTYCTN